MADHTDTCVDMTVNQELGFHKKPSLSVGKHHKVLYWNQPIGVSLGDSREGPGSGLLQRFVPGFRQRSSPVVLRAGDGRVNMWGCLILAAASSLSKPCVSREGDGRGRGRGREGEGEGERERDRRMKGGRQGEKSGRAETSVEREGHVILGAGIQH